MTLLHVAVILIGAGVGIYGAHTDHADQLSPLAAAIATGALGHASNNQRAPHRSTDSKNGGA